MTMTSSDSIIPDRLYETPGLFNQTSVANESVGFTHADAVLDRIRIPRIIDALNPYAVLFVSIKYPATAPISVPKIADRSKQQ